MKNIKNPATQLKDSPKTLKFRIWNGEKFLYSSQLGDKDDDFVSIALEGFIIPKYTKPKNYGNFVIQQFVGLVDKKGSRIFEGDIIQYKGKLDITYSKPGIVSFGEYFTHGKEFYHYGVRVKRLDMENTYFGLNKKDKNYLIIGNIFENPELGAAC